MVNPLIMVTGSCVLLTSCWARFPDSRFYEDGAAGSDAGPASDTRSIDGTPRCTAGEFIRCLPFGFERCSASGAAEQIDCGEASCDPQAGRCDACAPGESSCDTAGEELLECSDDGLFLPTACPAGCAEGACCPDGDDDGDGCTDCADDNADIFTGQTEFFEEATAGGDFDYDCSGSDDPEYPALVACEGQGANCSGDGWTGTIPQCGETGSFVTCQKKAGECVEQAPKDATQRCR